jgi:Ca-activated chloride channel family protein
MLGILLIVPLLALIYLVLQQRRKKFAAGSGFEVAGSTDRSGMRRHLPALIFLIGLVVLLFSLARPQATVSLPRYEGTVILLFDVSGSMVADDIEPTRMEAAKSIAADFVNDQPANVRIGVVAFSDGGLSVQSPSLNRDATLTTIERLVPRRGTSLGNGLLVALNTVVVDAGDPPIINTSDLSTADDVVTAPQGEYPSAIVIVFSDGENNDPPDPLEAAKLASDLGVRVYTVGVGTPKGTTIDVEGMNIHTQLNEDLLSQIAETASGQYYFAADETELRNIYADLQPELSIKPEDLELTSMLAGIGILVFLLGGTLSLLWFGRVL